MTQSRSADHFARLYTAKEDPWDFTTSAYEREKYQRTIAVLEDRHFSSGLEVGCSIGVLTSMLAARCDALLGLDIVEAPLVLARQRCARQPWVSFACKAVPQAWPDGTFDLIVLSEVLYFLTREDIERCVEHTRRSLVQNGLVVLVNWLGSTDDPTPGNEAAESFVSLAKLRISGQHRTSDYRLDVLQNN